MKKIVILSSLISLVTGIAVGQSITPATVTTTLTDPNNQTSISISGLNTPQLLGSARNISFDFSAAGKARIQAYRGLSWGTYLDFMTSSDGNTGGIPFVRMHIDENGRVGIGTTSPQQTLDVQGSFRIGSDANYLMYNGAADVRLRYSDRGSGGRAMVHDTGNRLTLNVGGDFTGGTSIGMGAYFTPGTTGTSYLYYGSFGVGTSDTKGYKFAVAGSAIAESMTVKLLGNWPDFVFKDNYQLTTLEETGRFIKDNGHLPGIPSAVEVKAKGIDLGEMNAKLLEKVEELTLHLIEQQRAAEREKKISEENRIRLDKEILELKEMIKKK